MKPIFPIRPLCLTLGLVAFGQSAQAQVPMRTAEDIAAVLEACTVITHANDYDAEGQTIAIPWAKATSRVSGYAPQGAPAKVSANVWGTDSNWNSFCDVLVDDAQLAQDAFDLFMTDREAVEIDGYGGFCFQDTFIQSAVSGPDSPIAKSMNAQGHINIHNVQRSGKTPCTP